jgi:hypothetical protein
MHLVIKKSINKESISKEKRFRSEGWWAAWIGASYGGTRIYWEVEWCLRGLKSICMRTRKWLRWDCWRCRRDPISDHLIWKWITSNWIRKRLDEPGRKPGFFLCGCLQWLRVAAFFCQKNELWEPELKCEISVNIWKVCRNFLIEAGNGWFWSWLRRS